MKQLVDFLQAHILETSEAEHATNIPMSRACIITEVAEFSVASILGLKPDDIIYELNGHAPAELDLVKACMSFRPHHYGIWRSEAQRDLQLKTTGIPLGIKVRPTIESIRYNFAIEREHFPAPFDFMHLWDHQDWDLLEDMADSYNKLTKKLIYPSKLERWRHAHIVEPHQGPAMLFKGIALYERGNIQQGYDLISKFSETYGDGWNVEFHAIAGYYKAREFIRNGNTEDALREVSTAYYQEQYTQFSDLIEQILKRPPTPLTSWLGLEFPADYRLNEIDGVSGQIIEGMKTSFSATIERLAPGQVLAICLMPDYRGNGPYNIFMHHYRAYASFAEAWMPALHVITDQTKRREDRPGWYQQEDVARQENRNFTLLYDEDCALGSLMDVRRTPTFFLVNNRAQVVYQGRFDNDFDFWSAIARAFETAQSPTGADEPPLSRTEVVH